MNPSFYVLSSGDESADGSTPNTSFSGSSHDTSRAKYHIQDVEKFASSLNDAAKNAFPNRGRSRYNTVNACLIRWEEDDLLVEPELKRLSNKFQDYGFTTNEWRIPSENSHLDLMMKTGAFIQNADNDKNLFIVYYGGHGRINNERQAEWLCKRDAASARVHWSAIQTLFAEAQSDVLILLDACAAASATSRSLHGSMEAIVACGFESKAPPPGEHSFTNALIDVLDDWINRRSFSVSCLHSEILSQLKLKENKKGREGRKLEWCVTPIYINCTQDSKIPSIELCRRNILSPPTACAKAPEPNPLADATDAMEIDLGSSGSSPIPALSSLSPSGQYGIPHVIISVALEEGQPDLDAKKTARWLENIPLLAKWAKVEAVYQSYSTLLILSVPVPIWNLVPDHPACSFVGYATSPNLVTSIKLPMSSEPTPTSVQNKATALGDVKVGRNPRNDLTHDKCTPKASFPYSPFQLITPDLDDSDGYYGISSPESQLSLRESSTTGDEDETQWDLRASQTPSIDIMSESGNRIPLSKDDNKRTDIPSFPLLSSTPADANSSSSMFHLDAPSQSGIDPNSRASLNNVELMTLTESEEKRRIDSKNLEIEKWRSRACLEDKDEDSASWPLSIRHQLPHTDENAEISPLDDQDSIHENEPIEGRVYYNSSNPNITETDRALMALPRPWYDPPSLLEITTTTHQPPTSNDAMRRYQECSDNISISSRAATSGIRRPRLREVSLSDFDSSVDRSFLKRFSPSKPGEEPHHQIRLFERELDQLHRSSGMISIERGGKRKRAMSLLEMPQNQNLEDPIMPPRTPGSYTHSNFTEYEQPAYLPRAKSTYTPTDPLPLKYLAKHVSTAYEQPSYFSTAGSNYNPDSPINFQSSMSMYPSSFSIEGYGLDPLLAGTNAVNNARAYEMMDTGYAQPKSDQPKPYRQATGTDHTNLGSPIDLGSTGKSGKQLPGNP